MCGPTCSHNHSLMLVKNDLLINEFLASPWFICREISLIFYTLIFEPFQWKTLIKFFKQLPSAMLKRGVIMSHKKVPAKNIRKWFT